MDFYNLDIFVLSIFSVGFSSRPSLWLIMPTSQREQAGRNQGDWVSDLVTEKYEIQSQQTEKGNTDTRQKTN